MIAVIIDSAVGSLDRYVGANGHVKRTHGAEIGHPVSFLGDTVHDFYYDPPDKFATAEMFTKAYREGGFAA